MEKLVHFGKYQHFKGMEYRVIKEVKIDGEIVVLYQKLYDDYSFWLRPRTMFLDYKDGVKRFTFIENSFVEISLPDEVEAIHSESEKKYKVIL